MSGVFKAIFGGGPSAAEKSADASAKQQVLLSARQAEGDAVTIAQGQSASSRLAAAAGKRVLAFDGFNTGTPGGLSNTLGGS